MINQLLASTIYSIISKDLPWLIATLTELEFFFSQWGRLKICSCIASDVWIMNKELKWYSRNDSHNGVTSNNEETAPISALAQLKLIALGSVPWNYIADSYNYVMGTFNLHNIVGSGGFLFLAPSLDYLYSVQHQYLFHDGRYSGMVTKAVIINNEESGNPFYQVFESIASAIYSFAELNPEKMRMLEDLYHDQEVDGPICRELCLQWLAAGLAYGSYFWQYVYGVGETDCLTDTDAAMWHNLIFAITEDESE